MIFFVKAIRAPFVGSLRAEYSVEATCGATNYFKVIWSPRRAEEGVRFLRVARYPQAVQSGSNNIGVNDYGCEAIVVGGVHLIHQAALLQIVFARYLQALFPRHFQSGQQQGR